jgi:hypothetical protein
MRDNRNLLNHKKTWIAQVRIGPNEMFVTVEASDIGQAILEVAMYLNKLDPSAIFEVYAVQVAENRDILLDDLILN